LACPGHNRRGGATHRAGPAAEVCLKGIQAGVAHNGPVAYPDAALRLTYPHLGIGIHSFRSGFDKPIFPKSETAE
jgi:hypothetical protein